jgi:hypothetical protein
LDFFHAFAVRFGNPRLVDIAEQSDDLTMLAIHLNKTNAD